jgi:hypothetical protein
LRVLSGLAAAKTDFTGGYGVHNDAEEARRALDQVRAIKEAEHVTVSCDPALLVAQETSDCADSARTWQVVPDALMVSDSRPDLANAHIRITGPRAALVIASDASLRGARIEIDSADALVFIGPHSRLNLVTVRVAGRRGTVIIGSETTWQSGSCLCQWSDQYAILADDCMLADEVILRTNDGHGIFDRTTHDKIKPAQPVILESHVWTGRRTTINKGAAGPGDVGSDFACS